MGNEKEEIALVFNVFHDGGLDKIQRDGQDLLLEIGSRYLAELVDPKYTSFLLRLRGVKQFEFRTWSDDELVIKDISAIEELFLEIMGADQEKDGLHVTCICHEEKFSGGVLCVEADGYELQSEGGLVISVERLIAISRQYWEEFGKRDN